MAGQQSVTAQGWLACEVGAGEDPPQFLCIGLAFPVVTAFLRTARVERNPGTNPLLKLPRWTPGPRSTDGANTN